MKKLTLLFSAIVLALSVAAQNVPNYEAYKINKDEDFTPEVDNVALQAATYILATPIDSKNINRLKSSRFLIEWMSGTPKYSFGIDQTALKFSKKDPELMILYMAGMVKFCLEHSSDANDQTKVKLNALKHIIAYVKRAENKIKINSDIKKLLDAENKGQLEVYIKE